MNTAVVQGYPAGGRAVPKGHCSGHRVHTLSCLLQQTSRTHTLGKVLCHYLLIVWAGRVFSQGRKGWGIRSTKGKGDLREDQDDGPVDQVGAGSTKQNWPMKSPSEPGMHGHSGREAPPGAGDKPLTHGKEYSPYHSLWFISDIVHLSKLWPLIWMADKE